MTDFIFVTNYPFLFPQTAHVGKLFFIQNNILVRVQQIIWVFKKNNNKFFENFYLFPIYSLQIIGFYLF